MREKRRFADGGEQNPGGRRRTRMAWAGGKAPACPRACGRGGERVPGTTARRLPWGLLALVPLSARRAGAGEGLGHRTAPHAARSPREGPVYMHLATGPQS